MKPHEQAVTKRAAGGRVMRRPCAHWLADRWPVFRFTLSVLGFIVALDALFAAPFWEPLRAACLGFNASLASVILNWAGQETLVTGGDTVSSAWFAVTVLPECAAGELMAFFGAAVLAFPARLGCKAAGIAMGLPAIALLNLVRIVSVFLIGASWPGWFPLAHEVLWPALLAAGALVLLLEWIRWQARREARSWQQAGLIRGFYSRFVLVFALLSIPWPGEGRLCSQAFCAAGRMICGTPQEQRTIRELAFIPEPDGAGGARIEIAKFRMPGGNEDDPVRNLDLNPRAVLFCPALLYLALVMTTPVSGRRRLWALGLGETCLLACVVVVLSVAVWNESTELGFVTLTPFWKGVANHLQGSLVRLLLVIPFLIWLLMLRYSDFAEGEKDWPPGKDQRLPLR